MLAPDNANLTTQTERQGGRFRVFSFQCSVFRKNRRRAFDEASTLIPEHRTCLLTENRKPKTENRKNMLTLTRHWIDQARRVPSPNHNEHPEPADISLVVIHNISLPPGQFGGAHIEALFQNRLDASRHPYFETIHELRVSSHFLIRRDGELVQFVPCDRRAWHAGV